MLPPRGDPSGRAMTTITWSLSIKKSPTAPEADVPSRTRDASVISTTVGSFPSPRGIARILSIVGDGSVKLGRYAAGDPHAGNRRDDRGRNSGR